MVDPFPTNIYLFKVNDINARKRCEICLKLTIKTPERRHRTPMLKCDFSKVAVQLYSNSTLPSLFYDVILVFFIVDFEHISHLFLVSIVVYCCK